MELGHIELRGLPKGQALQGAYCTLHTTLYILSGSP